ncbi:MAG: hypothetical protein WC953_00375 [Pseudomonas sp.]
MRLDGFHPTALPARPSRPAHAPVGQASNQTATTAPASVQPVSAKVVERTAAMGEYIPARQGPAQPVYGYANQALNSYQSMASMPDADTDVLSGIDLFV